MQVVTVLHEQHGVDYREMAVITPYSAQKSLIHKLKNEKHAEATGSSVGGASRHPPDTKLKELTVVSITESQGKVSLHVPCSPIKCEEIQTRPYKNGRIRACSYIKIKTGHNSRQY